jgi:hypothetical protein
VEFRPETREEADRAAFPPPTDSAEEAAKEEDPGDGIEVAKFLAVRAPICPVIVHASNVTHLGWMIGEFELGGWEYKRVTPIGDDWIEAYWRVVARKLLKRSASLEKT